MSTMVKSTCTRRVLAVCLAAIGVLPASGDDVVFENRRMTLRIGGDGGAICDIHVRLLVFAGFRTAHSRNVSRISRAASAGSMSELSIRR